MLAHSTSEWHVALGRTGMAKALDEQRRADATFEPLCFEDRLGLLVEREAAERDGKRMSARLKLAALRQAACVEDLDLRAPRGIDWPVMAHLGDGAWIDRHENLLITGLPGLGKSWIAYALGHKACRDGWTVAYHRVPRLFEVLATAKGDGRYARLLKSLAKTDVLILNDWGLGIIAPTERRDLLEILEDHHGRGSTIVTSHLPVDHWHGAIVDPTQADAILDRLVYNAHPLFLSRESLRRRASVAKPLDQSDQAWLHEAVDQPTRVREMDAQDGVTRVPKIARNRCPKFAKYAVFRVASKRRKLVDANSISVVMSEYGY